MWTVSSSAHSSSLKLVKTAQNPSSWAFLKKPTFLTLLPTVPYIQLLTTPKQIATGFIGY